MGARGAPSRTKGTPSVAAGVWPPLELGARETLPPSGHRPCACFPFMLGTAPCPVGAVLSLRGPCKQRRQASHPLCGFQ